MSWGWVEVIRREERRVGTGKGRTEGCMRLSGEFRVDGIHPRLTRERKNRARGGKERSRVCFLEGRRTKERRRGEKRRSIKHL